MVIAEYNGTARINLTQVVPTTGTLAVLTFKRGAKTIPVPYTFVSGHTNMIDASLSAVIPPGEYTYTLGGNNGLIWVKKNVTGADTEYEGVITVQEHQLVIDASSAASAGIDISVSANVLQISTHGDTYEQQHDSSVSVTTYDGDSSTSVTAYDSGGTIQEG